MSHSGVAPQKDDSRGTQHKKADADTKDSARKALQCKGDSHTQEHRRRIVVIIKSTFGWCNRPLQQVRRVEENNQAFRRNEKLPEALETVHQCHQAPPHDDRITEQIRQRALEAFRCGRRPGCSPLRGEPAAVGGYTSQMYFLLLLLSGGDVPGCGYRPYTAKPSAQNLWCPRQPSCVECRGYRLFVVLPQNDSFGGPLGLRSWMLVLRPRKHGCSHPGPLLKVHAVFFRFRLQSVFVLL